MSSGVPTEYEAAARATAAAAGLAIEDRWWPGVLGHLGVLLAGAASLEGLEGAGLDLPDDPAPVFAP